MSEQARTTVGGGWRRWWPLTLVLAALLVGRLGGVSLAGREFVVSGIDVAAVLVGAAGLVVAWRRRSARVDVVVGAYAAMLAVIAIQVALLDDRAEIVGGSSRFVVPLLLVVGLSQLWPAASTTDAAGTGTRSGGPWPPGERPAWRWPAQLAGFGVVLAAWVAVEVVAGVLDPARDRFYEIKNAVDIPLGASNYLAAFLLVAALVAGVHARRDRRLLVASVVASLGVLLTLSRGAVIAGLGTVALGALVGGSPRTRRRVAVAVGVAAVAVGAFLAVVTPDFGDRAALYDRALDTFLAEPVLGHGLNRFEEVSAGLAAPHVNAHNLELHALATTGILGALAYLAIWGVLAVRLWRAGRGPERDALALAATALFLHAQVEALAYSRAVEALLAVLVVLAGTLPGAVGVAAWRRPWPASTVSSSSTSGRSTPS